MNKFLRLDGLLLVTVTCLGLGDAGLHRVFAQNVLSSPSHVDQQPVVLDATDGPPPSTSSGGNAPRYGFDDRFDEAQTTDAFSPPTRFRSRDGEAESSGGGRQVFPLATVGGSLAIVLALFGGLAFLAKRSGATGAGQLPKESFQILGRAALGPRQTAMLVRCGRRIMLLSLGGSQITTLTEFDEPDEVNSLLAQCDPMGKQFFQQTLHSMGKEPTGNNRFVADSAPDPPSSLFARH